MSDRQLGKLRVRATGLRARTEQMSREYERLFDVPLNTMGDTLTVLPLLSGNLLRIQNLSSQWTQISAVLDQKEAASLAYIALYISILSLLLTVLLPALAFA